MMQGQVIAGKIGVNHLSTFIFTLKRDDGDLRHSFEQLHGLVRTLQHAHFYTLRATERAYDMLHIALDYQASGANDGDVATHLGKVKQDMRADHNGFAHTLQGAQQLAKLYPGPRIEARSWVVEQ